MKLFYFEHHANSRNDVKLIQLDDAVGQHTGYALYFQTLEIMLELDGFVLPVGSIGSIARMLFVTRDIYAKFLDCAVDLGLFDFDGLVYSSPRFLEWAERKAQIREQNSEKGKLGGRPRKQVEGHEAVTSPADESVRGVSEVPVTKLNPISDESDDKLNPKPRQNYSAECQRIFEVWNAQKIKVHREISDQLKTALRKALRKYSVEQILSAIENYSQRLSDPNDFINYRWTLLEFVSRSNGLPVYVERAENTEQAKIQIATQTVKTHDGEDEKRKEESSLISKLNGSIWSSFGSLRDLLGHIWSYPTPESKMKYINTLPERLKQIVLAPASKPMVVIRDGCNVNLANEYEEMKK